MMPRLLMLLALSLMLLIGSKCQALTIDWDNLPICGDPPVIVISPYICQMPPGVLPPVDPPVEPPVAEVPVPATLPLMALGLGLIATARRKRHA